MATSGGSLTPLQGRLLALLSDVAPPWVLTGGAALVGFYTAHRSTRDLFLRWPGQADLVGISRAVEARLRAARLAFEVLQSAPTFRRLRVIDSGDVVIIDLVADLVPSIEEPAIFPIEEGRVQVDTPHEILVNKLCALLGRAELRDLDDVRALLDAGGELDRALSDAPRKDGGFSPLTLAWVLQDLPVSRLAEAAGWAPDAAAELDRFRSGLVDRLLADAAPEPDA